MDRVFGQGCSGIILDSNIGDIEFRQFQQAISQKLLIFQKESSMTSTTVSRKKIQNYSYIITNVIGKGYSSQVFKGRNDLTSQGVAIKVIDLKMLKNEINKVLLQSQIQILKQIKALPHVLNLYDVFTTKNNTYIITELCDYDLAKTIRQKLTQTEACSYMQQIIQGYLNFAAKDIIHRDLKPANILVYNEQLKIADFGFAIKLRDAHKYNKYNVGSPLYMAPESLKRNDYSLQSDIWALGIIFYEMLTGSTPWKAKNEKELLKKIESQSIDDILQIMAISNTSKSFLRKTLRVDTKSRLTRQDLQEFNFSSVNSSNILMQKKLNGVKAMNHQKSLSIFEQNLSMQICKTPKIAQKKASVKQIFLKKTDAQINNQNISIKIHKPVQTNSIKTINFSLFNNPQQKRKNFLKQSPSGTPLNYKSVNACTQKARQQSMAQKNRQESTATASQRKLTTKMLISQIHYCRFLYKLIMKILQSSKKGLLQCSRAQVERILCSYVGIIKHKIENVMSFTNANYLGAVRYEEYRLSSDFQKIMKIAKQYKTRYSKDLIIYWSTATANFSISATDDLISHIHKLLKIRKGSEDILTKFERQIAILDDLITSRFLLEYFKDGENYQRFARRSKIEEIVEGRALSMTGELLERILERAMEVTGGNEQMPQIFFEEGVAI